MNTTALRRWIGRFALGAFVVAVLSFTGVTGKKLAASGADCADYACADDEACQSVDCDMCFTHDRCASLIQLQ